MSAESTLEHWSVETDGDNIAWCRLDVQGKSANVLSQDVLTELRQVVARLESAPPRGVVFYSGKDGGFIAGADVNDFTRIENAAEAERVIRDVHALLDNIELLPFPTLALINGFCLGGGLELALACRYRVALDDPATRLGFPEVMLGIFPGFGGSMRSVRQIGAVRAMQLMLTGRNVDARRAMRLGLLDRVVPDRQMHAAARTLLLQDAVRSRRGGLHALLNIGPLRRLLAWYLRRQLRGRVRREHYPAPYELVDHWERNGGSERDMLDGEARSVAQLVTSGTSRNLVRVYLLQERLKAAAAADHGPDFRRVHVVGAGTMGGDIAAWCVSRGLHVTIQDREPRFIAPAMRRAHELFRKRLKKPRLVQGAMDRLLPDLHGHGAARADVIIEAIIEDREAKLELFRELQSRAGPEAILATNTSSIALELLGEGLQQPDRLVGIHFFNPVAKMQLVEIVSGPRTGSRWAARAAAFCRAIGRLPLPVKSAPGFLVNRILTPYLMEATLMLEEGIPAEVIDAAATRFGMPMGPIELADTVGLDICLSVARNLKDKLNVEIPGRLEQLVDAGRLGRKSGAGIYDYRRGKPKKRKVDAGRGDADEIEERLVMRILNECAACLREGIVADADLLDAGMIFATGFAPFRGGPMHYAADKGAEDVVDTLRSLEQKFGPRFTPDPHWEALPT